MMKCVLIAEPDTQRFEELQRTLEGAFELKVFKARTLIEIRDLCKSEIDDLKLVLLTKPLPHSDQRQCVPLQSCFTQLQGMKLGVGCGALIGYIYAGDEEQFVDVADVDLFVPFPGSDTAKTKFLDCFEGFFLNRRLPRVVLDDDPLLKELVRALGNDRGLEDGQQKLRGFLSEFLHHPQLTIYRLQSGFSGACVYRVQAQSQSGNLQYLIKVSRDCWKLKEETERHANVIGGIPGLREYKAKLLKPRNELQNDGYIVSYGNWHAVCFEYLGGGAFGSSLNLQDALIMPPKRIDARLLTTADDPDGVSRYRSHFLNILLDWLKREWCTNHNHVGREVHQPWSTVSADDQKYNPFPPYKLTGQVKGWILEFFDGIGAQMGNRLLPDWSTTADLVKRFVCSDGIPASSKLEVHVSMILSPAHGDLNANNVLFFPELPDPIFLIDFAMYQKCGHALQDFARLETEIKYALMDCQQDSPVNELPGFDSTPGQFQLWLELENHLLGNIWREPKTWSSTGFRRNLDLTLQLVQSIRTVAGDIQKQNLQSGLPPSFEDEYLYPLLYHTLQAITYRSLSPFKRLLAVHSSAELLRKVGFA
jgi:hypothetical protein